MLNAHGMTDAACLLLYPHIWDDGDGGEETKLNRERDMVKVNLKSSSRSRIRAQLSSLLILCSFAIASFKYYSHSFTITVNWISEVA